MIAKLIVPGATATKRWRAFARAIDEYVIEGVPTTLPLLRALCDFDPVATPRTAPPRSNHSPPS